MRITVGGNFMAHKRVMTVPKSGITTVKINYNSNMSILKE